MYSMRKLIRTVSHHCLGLVFVMAAALAPMGGAIAADTAPAATPAAPAAPAAPVKLVASVELPKLQKQLDTIKQRASAATNDNQLSALNDATQKLSADADALVASIQPDRAQVQAQLDILGPPPAEGAMAETSVVAQQRITLNNRKTLIDGQLEHAKAIGTGATNLSAQIADIRRSALRTQMALNSGSILAGSFWTPLFNTSPQDKARLDSFGEDFVDAWHSAWEPEWRLGSAALLVMALVVWIFGSRLLDKLLGWFSIHILPEGRLRRSFLACATALVTVFSVGLGAECIFLLFTRHPDAAQTVVDFANELFR